jgi:hypothetical protein
VRRGAVAQLTSRPRKPSVGIHPVVAAVLFLVAVLLSWGVSSARFRQLALPRTAAAPVYLCLPAAAVVALQPGHDGTLRLRAWVSSAPPRADPCHDLKRCICEAWMLRKERVSALAIAGGTRVWNLALAVLSHAPEHHGGTSTAMI